MGTTTKPNYTQVRRVAREARERIERDGWAKGAYKQGKAVCLLQAIRDVNHTVVEPDRQEVIRLCLNLTGTAEIPSYNDRPGVTKEDVLTILQAVEHIAEEYQTG